MSSFGMTQLAWDLEHRSGLLEAYREDAPKVLGAYPLSAVELEGIMKLDAHSLLATGVNAVVLRNLLVILGVPHRDMYKRRDG